MKFRRKVDLSDDVVYRICTLVELGLSYKEIIRKLELGDEKYYKNVITGIVTRNQYKHISKYFNLPNRKAKRFTKKEVKEICFLLERGYSLRDIYHTVCWGKHSYKASNITIKAIFNREWYTRYSATYKFPETLVTRGFVKLKSKDIKKHKK